MSTAPTRSTTPQQSATHLYDDVRRTADAIDRGDWLQAGMGVTNAAMDIIGLGGDPLGAISSAGFGWLIGHISFLREPFDVLLGNPGAITSTAGNWSSAAATLNSAAQKYASTSRQQTVNWTGDAADAYRSTSAEHAQSLS